MNARSLLTAQRNRSDLMYSTATNPDRVVSGLRNDLLLLTNSGNASFFCVIFLFLVGIFSLFGLLMPLQEGIPSEEEAGCRTVYLPTAGNGVSFVSTVMP